MSFVVGVELRDGGLYFNRLGADDSLPEVLVLFEDEGGLGGSGAFDGVLIDEFCEGGASEVAEAYLEDGFRRLANLFPGLQGLGVFVCHVRAVRVEIYSNCTYLSKPLLCTFS